MSALSSLDPALGDAISRVYAFYAALAPTLDPRYGLGGCFVYAGRLGAETPALLRAANIAGAASLAVSADRSALGDAARAGIVDFQVASLDEAVRILKNEIRKRQPVSVAIAAQPAAIGQEMLERGLQPDLLAPDAVAIEPHDARAAWLAHGGCLLTPLPAPRTEPLHLWPLPALPAGGRARLDAALLTLLPGEAHAARRWLRLSPRYLDRRARAVRSFAGEHVAASRVSALLEAEMLSL